MIIENLFPNFIEAIDNAIRIDLNLFKVKKEFVENLFLKENVKILNYFKEFNIKFFKNLNECVYCNENSTENNSVNLEDVLKKYYNENEIKQEEDEKIEYGTQSIFVYKGFVYFKYDFILYSECNIDDIDYVDFDEYKNEKGYLSYNE